MERSVVRLEGLYIIEVNPYELCEMRNYLEEAIPEIKFANNVSYVPLNAFLQYYYENKTIEASVYESKVLRFSVGDEINEDLFKRFTNAGNIKLYPCYNRIEVIIEHCNI